MTSALSPIDKSKFLAAKKATEFVEYGMKVGLGTGSTAAWFVQCLGEMVRDDGFFIKAVATSNQTAQLAKDAGLHVISLDDAMWMDLTVDGTDEYDPQLNLIKGGGGALLREKIVASASERMIVIADVSKKVAQLGAFPLPVEVIPFGWSTTKCLIEEALVGMDVDTSTASLRRNGEVPFVTDQGNYILDLQLGRIGDARQMSFVLNQVPGVVENGLFIDICDMIIIGDQDGRVAVTDIHTGAVDETQYEIREEPNIFADEAE